MSDTVELFITRWQTASGSERANYQLFLTELAALLDLPRPDPAAEDTRDNAYVFERRVQFRHGDGSSTKRCCAQRSQAEEYARALPALGRAREVNGRYVSGT